MKFSYHWLKELSKTKLSPEKMAELLTRHSFEVGEVEKMGKDWQLDIDVLPNRAGDCFSHLGIAREIAAITHLTFYPGGEKVKLIEDKKLKAKDFISVEIKNKEACPRYTARVVTDVKVAPSPKWIQERLKVCGLRAINNIVDILNYVMLETGQPLHAFDGEKLKGQKIIVRFGKKGESIVTLDEEKYELDENILVIADEDSPVAIAGIKGGKIAEIDKKTKIVILESANFNPQVIRKSSKRIDLKTDASLRFEHGIDPNLTEVAINRAAYLIQKIAEGKIAKGLVDFYPRKVLPKKIKLNLDYVKRLLGVKIPEKEIKNILKKLNFKLRKISSQEILVEVPTFRLDISLPEDLIEEIGRIYGYEKIPVIFPISALIPLKRNLEIFWEENVKDILKEAGFSETYNYSFISEKDAKIFQFEKKDLIEVENPVSLEYQYLRPSLIINLLKNVKKNQRVFPEIKIFELGKIFKKIYLKKSAPGKIIEKKMLTGLIRAKEDQFYQLKGIVDLLLEKLGISQIWYDQYQPTPEESKILIWHPKKLAEIKVNGEEIGFLGEISPKILETLGLEKGLVLFDLDFEKLQKLASEEHEYQPISRYPAAIRDIAILVPRLVRVEEVLNKIEAAGGSLVRDIDLFDIYEGEGIPEGKKNLAFHIIFQAEDRTLSSKEIDEIQNKIIKTLEEDPEWEVRK